MVTWDGSYSDMVPHANQWVHALDGYGRAFGEQIGRRVYVNGDGSKVAAFASRNIFTYHSSTVGSQNILHAPPQVFLPDLRKAGKRTNMYTLG